MSSTGPLALIEKLMRLALNNPNDEEARSAAMKCLRLMAEHNATITLPQPMPTSSQSNLTYDMLRDLMNQQQAAQNQQQNYYNNAFGNAFGFGYNPFDK